MHRKASVSISVCSENDPVTSILVRPEIQHVALIDFVHFGKGQIVLRLKHGPMFE